MGKPVEYEDMPIKKLSRVIGRNRILFVVVVTVYFLIGGISTLVVYSFDPVFAVALISMLVGIMSICFCLFYMFSKIIWYLRVLSGEVEQVEKVEKKVDADLTGTGIIHDEKIY